MRSWRLAVIGAIASMATAVSGHAQGPPPTQKADAPPTGVIAGRVVDAVSGGTVPKAALILLAPGNASWPRSGLRAATDDAGRFEFSGLPGGSYTVSVQADGYVWGSYGALTPGDPVGNRIDLLPAEKLPDVAIRLWPQARLSGAVTDERGEPVVGFTVRFLRRHYIGARQVWMGSGQAKTDDRGRFQSANNLRPGDYLVLLPAEPASLRESAVTHESVFYGGARTAAAASVITLGAGEHRQGVDLVTTFTPRPKVLSVSGVITAPASVPLFGIVSLVRNDAEDPVAEIEGFKTKIGQGGKFSFSHVPLGEYRVRAVVPPRVSGGASASWGLRTIGKPASVSDVTTWFVDLPLSLTKPVDDLVVPLQAGSRIRGRVAFDGRSTLPPADVLNTILMHVLHADARELNQSIVGLPTGAVDAQGRFETVGLPPGKYVLDPTANIENVRHTVTSVQIGGRELLGTGLDLGTTDLTDVVVTLSNRTWNLSGVVRDQAGRPVAGGRVIIFPREPTERHLVGYDTHPRVKHIAADRSGAFQLTGAFAGEHVIAAVASPPEFWMAPEYLETLVPNATLVRLQPGDKRSIDLRLP